MFIGCHVSIKEGYYHAAKSAKQLNAASFQYFPKNPRSLNIKAYDTEDTRLCKQFCHEHDIVSISHSPYPTNLTPESPEQKKRVVRSILNDLHISDACGSLGVVVHFGKNKDANNPLYSYQLMIEVINEVMEQWDGKSMLLLENNAGKPGSIGTTMEELVKIRQLIDRPNSLGFCLDTCHAFASGLWNGDNWEYVMEHGNNLGYFQNLKVIHLNNSKYQAKSGKDRHANIFHGGYITEKQFDSILQSSVIQNIPLILETPKDKKNSHENEIAEIKSRWGR
ncbi:deoxyribonuclease IV [Sediminibacillus massiliensis]|uniref:deoxyribonuclease IV n=1 Tax=Sediminibacillus massiliensis TaxID=1926277 RepID=UPI00098852AE|nr:deoxyribonuclease IV [Sediminibacillus massiliensis]